MGALAYNRGKPTLEAQPTEASNNESKKNGVISSIAEKIIGELPSDLQARVIEIKQNNSKSYPDALNKVLIEELIKLGMTCD